MVISMLARSERLPTAPTEPMADGFDVNEENVEPTCLYQGSM